MKKIFTVRAKTNYLKDCGITCNKSYKVYSVTFPKLNPEGLFYIYNDFGYFKRYSSNYFEPVEEE